MAYNRYELQLPVMLYLLQKHYKRGFYPVPLLQQSNYVLIMKPSFFYDTPFLHQSQSHVSHHLQLRLLLMQQFRHFSLHIEQYMS